jgi:hypothetical protein
MNRKTTTTPHISLEDEQKKMTKPLHILLQTPSSNAAICEKASLKRALLDAAEEHWSPSILSGWCNLLDFDIATVSVFQEESCTVSSPVSKRRCIRGLVRSKSINRCLDRLALPSSSSPLQ